MSDQTIHVGFDVAISMSSENGDLTIEFISQGNHRRALLGLGYSEADSNGKTNWITLLGKGVENEWQDVPYESNTQALRVIRDWMDVSALQKELK